MGPDMRLLKPAAVVFDAYGTLFDVHSAVGRLRQRMGDRAEAISTLWRTKQLEYTWLRSLMGAYADFQDVTADALDFAFGAEGLGDPALKQELLAAYFELDAYPEVPSTLKALRLAGSRTAILSNGSSGMLDAVVNHAGLTSDLDSVLSVEAVGVFKPHPSVYALAEQHLNARRDRLLFVSANAWDIAGASHFGLRTAWVNRFNQPIERLPGGADVEIHALDGLLSVLDLT